MRSFRTLLKNELKLNIRNMNMVIFAIILPLVVRKRQIRMCGEIFRVFL